MTTAAVAAAGVVATGVAAGSPVVVGRSEAYVRGVGVLVASSVAKVVCLVT